MPVPIVKIIMNERYLVGNSIRASLWAGADNTVIYKINRDPDLELIYQGEIHSVTGWAGIDFSSIFQSLITSAGAGKYIISLLAPDTMNEYASHSFSVYYGAISKLLTRKLLNSGLNDGVFDWKLKNSETNFFLTTRTNDYVIHVPEDELLPLKYYAKGLKFTIKNGDDILLTRDHSADADETLQEIDFNSIRRTVANDLNKWVSEFRIMNDAGWSCSVLITQRDYVTDCFLKFKNSWGVFEKISLIDYSDFAPEFKDQEKISVFDTDIYDFVQKSKRKSISNRYTAKTPLLNNEERLFVLDALQSDEVYFIVNDNEFACNVSSPTKIFTTKSGDPISIDFDIELIDVEKYFSSIVDSNISILTADQSDVTADEADILM